MLDHDLARLALRRGLRPTDLFGDLFVEQTDIVECSVSPAAVQTISRRQLAGAGLRGVGSRAIRYVHTPDLSEAGLQQLVGALRDETIMPLSASAARSVPHTAPPTTELVQLAREAAAAAQQASAGLADTQINVLARATHQEVLIVRSDERIARDVRRVCELFVNVVVREAGKARRSRRTLGASTLHELRHSDGHRIAARAAVEAARQQLAAVEAPTGMLTVVLAPGRPAALLHEACGHALEADIALHPHSAYAGLVGTAVAAPIVTLIDDPRAPADAPCYAIDDEGEPAMATVLIEQGVLRSYLYDRWHAQAVGRSSTGHGRRRSYAYPPLPRMGATYIAPGTSAPDEIIAETEQGLLVLSIAGGDAEATGRFKLIVDEGYLVEQGQVTAPIRRAVLVGDGRAVLRSIDRIGHDLKVVSGGGGCNKLDQFLPTVALGQPTLRVRGLMVTND